MTSPSVFAVDGVCFLVLEYLVPASSSSLLLSHFRVLEFPHWLCPIGFYLAEAAPQAGWHLSLLTAGCLVSPNQLLILPSPDSCHSPIPSKVHFLPSNPSAQKSKVVPLDIAAASPQNTERTNVPRIPTSSHGTSCIGRQLIAPTRLLRCRLCISPFCSPQSPSPLRGRKPTRPGHKTCHSSKYALGQLERVGTIVGAVLGQRMQRTCLRVSSIAQQVVCYSPNS